MERDAPLSAAILAGGRSRRMGRDKARLDLAGSSFLERAAALLREVCGEVVLACGPEPRYADLGLSLALDGEPDGGPLAGLIAGLEALDTERALVIACDMPRLSRRVFEVLFERASSEDLDACFLASERGLEPLCAIYSRRCLPHMKRSLAEGRRRVTGFLDLDQAGADGGASGSNRALRIGRVDISEIDPVGSGLARDGSAVLTNVNTPEELERERQARRGEELA